jgi:ATP-dependent exoDNAse (exonuclease V) beta subunit
LAYVVAKGVTPLPLSKSFRFGPPIAEVANKFLSELGAFQIEGAASHESESTTIFDEFYEGADALLVRTNAGGLQAFMALTNQDPARAIHLNVETKEIFSLIDAIMALQAGEKADHYELMNYDTYEELLEDIENDAVDYQITLIHRSMEMYGGKAIKARLYKMPKADECDLHILTAHKSKGCEWDNVAIYPDFTLSESAIRSASSVPEEYLRLCYVAITRAKKKLDWSPLYDFQERIAQIRSNLLNDI